MRIQIKGGVWKNTEDEILKVAVMKYGKNQWARISSLLVRKSAKQCKARWYEWLDPSIKKTEWTREEEEKLLHLAKILPTQWRTIAPIVGRTAAQCLEHYERLLDAAQDKDGTEDLDDPRRLRSGEIDPNPESKAARPDPIDMDEDEKEMLSEARARLANTKGKKAKRKAREKALEEARRLASLQKRRELKAAGIEIRRYKKKKRYVIDYNEEIPFEKVPARGFHDVTEERKNTLALRNDPKFLGRDIQDVDEKRRDGEEERERKKDAKREKLFRTTNLPAALLRANQQNDPEYIARRTKLVLPAPDITDGELEDIAKIGNMGPPVMGSGPGKTLLSRYETPGRTPARTPQRTALTRDTILQDTQNLIMLTEQQTPLLGEDNAKLHPTDFRKLTREQTPSAMKTPQGTPKGGLTPYIPGMTPNTTPGRGATPNRTPSRTPMRDNLGLNDPNAMDLSAEDAIHATTRRVQKRKRAELQSKLKMSFQNLPEPQMEYSLVLPQLPRDDEMKKGLNMEEDAEDAQVRRSVEAQAEVDRKWKRRSQVIQLDLPRPIRLNPFTACSDPIQQAVQTEALTLMYYDESLNPVVGDDAQARKKIKLTEVFDDQLENARYLVSEEIGKTGGFPTDEALLTSIASAVNERLAFVPSLKRFGLWSELTHAQKLEATKADFKLLRGQLTEQVSAAKAVEKKVNILLGGYGMRAKKQTEHMLASAMEIVEQDQNAICFGFLQEREAAAVPVRLAYAKKQVDIVGDRQRELQAEYGSLCADLRDLEAKPKAVKA